MAQRRRLGNLIGGLVLLAFIGYSVWPFLAGPGQMSRFCRELTMAATINEVQQAVASRGYRLRIDAQGEGPIVDPRSMGRFICHVAFTEGRLTSACYLHND